MSELQSSVASGVGELRSTPAAVPTTTLLARWYVLLMMCLVYTLSIADRYVVSTVLDPIRIELHLTDSGVAWLTGVAFGLFYVVLGFPLSYLIDRYNRRKIVAVCLVLWSAMTALCGFARNSWQFFFARVGVTVGEAGGTPGANSLLSDYFPASRRAMALTVFSPTITAGAPSSWPSAYLACSPASQCGSRCASRNVAPSMPVMTARRPLSARRCVFCGNNGRRYTS